MPSHFIHFASCSGYHRAMLSLSAAFTIPCLIFYFPSFVISSQTRDLFDLFQWEGKKTMLRTHKDQSAASITSHVSLPCLALPYLPYLTSLHILHFSINDKFEGRTWYDAIWCNRMQWDVVKSMVMPWSVTAVQCCVVTQYCTPWLHCGLRCFKFKHVISLTQRPHLVLLHLLSLSIALHCLVSPCLTLSCCEICYA
jgi:hypothetical protein